MDVANGLAVIIESDQQTFPSSSKYQQAIELLK